MIRRRFQFQHAVVIGVIAALAIVSACAPTTGGGSGTTTSPTTAAPTTTTTPAPLPELGAIPSDDIVPPTVLPGAEQAVSIDLRRWAAPVGQQGDMGSCASWAVAGLTGWYTNLAMSGSGYPSQTPLSANYLYSQVATGPSSGSGVDENLRIARDSGVDRAEHYGPSEQSWGRKPNYDEHYYARTFRLADFRPLFSVGSNRRGGSDGRISLRQHLSTGNPVAIALRVRPGFDALGNGVDHDVTGPVRGLHAVLAVGYDSSGILIQNSWGTDWGQGGYGRLGWDKVEDDVYEGWITSGLRNPGMPSLRILETPWSGWATPDGHFQVTTTPVGAAYLHLTLGLHPGALPSIINDNVCERFGRMGAGAAAVSRCQNQTADEYATAEYLVSAANAKGGCWVADIDPSGRVQFFAPSFLLPYCA